MTSDAIVAQVVAFVDSQQSVQAVIAQLNDDDVLQVAQGLKQQVLYYLRSDAPKAFALTQTILDIADCRALPQVYALGLQTKAISLTLLQREYETALTLFAESEAIYAAVGDELSIAVGQVAKVWALACLQRFDEAYEAGAWAEGVLRAHEAHRTLAALNNNLAAIYGRRGQDEQALQRILEVEGAYKQLGEEGQRRLPLAQMNRALVLRNLGQYEASIAINKTALATAEQLAQNANIARAKQILGMTYFVVGRINEALVLLQDARDIFLADERDRDAILVDLFISDGYLHLRHFETVLEKCRQVQQTFQEVGTQFEAGQAMLNEAIALAGLGEFNAAYDVLDKAKQLFAHEENQPWQIYTDLEKALLFYQQERFTDCYDLASRAIPELAALSLPLKEAQAAIIAGQAALAMGNLDDAQTYLAEAETICQEKDIPSLTYQCYFWQGQLCLARNQPQLALNAFETAVRALERLQGQIMVEFRADFLADKDSVYGHAVALCLASENPEVALEYAERAKSRALLTLLSHHVNLRIEAHSAQDEPLVQELLALCAKRNRLHRRWETGEETGSSVDHLADQEEAQRTRAEARQAIIDTEDKIRKQWHRLLIRNAAYTDAASLWRVQTQVQKSALDKETVLLEYFALPDGFVVFLVSQTAVIAHRLSVSTTELQQLRQRLQHNFNTLQQAPQLQTMLTQKAQLLLHAFFQQLIAPIIDELTPYQNLLIVPHGMLHYLPFHAFYDGQDYLLNRFHISYLPGSSFMGLLNEAPPSNKQQLIMGHHCQGRLPHVQDEVEAIAQMGNGRFYLNQDATRAVFEEHGEQAQLIHLATHGDFKPQNPLFSGLQLADGMLTTLDVFNTRLSASLVTLSACQTGRSIVSGGDELFGLMRAFLTAGSSSLLLTLWPVADETTTQLMRTFYTCLFAGQSKIAALQAAQKAQVSDEINGRLYDHPYYWAPFFLVGHRGHL